MSALSSRPANLGLVNGKLAECPATPNCVCSQKIGDAHYIAPLNFDGEPANAWEKLAFVVRAMDRTTIIDKRTDYLYAEFRTRLFRFVDDVEFALDAPAKVIHVRSASRVGYSDLGLNRRRIEEIRGRFSAQNP